MDQDLKSRWVDALRSGKYTQGRGALRKTNDTFCSLGVLCDQINPYGWSSGFKHYKWSDGGMFPTWRTISVPVNIIPGLDMHFIGTLMGMNDCGKHSFADIADHIEKNL